MSHQIITADCLSWMQAQPAQSVDLVIGSSPYAEKGERYGNSEPWPTDEWIKWMTLVTLQAVKVTKNVVIWIVNGSVLDGEYHPACEGLVYELYRSGIRCERPCIWHKNAPPSRKDWFGNDWEYCLAFRPAHSNRYFDWKSIAEPPKYTAGGKFRQRTKTGERREGSEYPKNELARPRDVFRVTVGGGHLGSKLAHINHAPYPEGIVEPFVRSLCPIGGTVLDPFGGSGTTMAVCILNGRNSISVDIQPDQNALMQRRRAEAYQRLLDREGTTPTLRTSLERLIRSHEETNETDET